MSIHKYKVGDIVRVIKDNGFLHKGLAVVIGVTSVDMLCKNIENPYDESSWWGFYDIISPYYKDKLIGGELL